MNKLFITLIGLLFIKSDFKQPGQHTLPGNNSGINNQPSIQPVTALSPQGKDATQVNIIQPNTRRNFLFEGIAPGRYFIGIPDVPQLFETCVSLC